MKYEKLNEKIQKKLSDFPIGWAFSDKQLDDVMKKLNVSCLSELLHVGQGGFIKKTDRENWSNMWKEIEAMKKDYLKTMKNLEKAIYAEISNHECCYSGDYSVVVEKLELDLKNPDVKKLFVKVVKKCKKEFNECN